MKVKTLKSFVSLSRYITLLRFSLFSLHSPTPQSPLFTSFGDEPPSEVVVTTGQLKHRVAGPPCRRARSQVSDSVPSLHFVSLSLFRFRFEPEL